MFCACALEIFRYPSVLTSLCAHSAVSLENRTPEKHELLQCSFENQYSCILETENLVKYSPQFFDPSPRDPR